MGEQKLETSQFLLVTNQNIASSHTAARVGIRKSEAGGHQVLFGLSGPLSPESGGKSQG
jgi:hypothetical protein